MYVRTHSRMYVIIHACVYVICIIYVMYIIYVPLWVCVCACVHELYIRTWVYMHVDAHACINLIFLNENKISKYYFSL